MVALDFDAIEGAGVTANQQAAGEIHSRQGIQTALGHCPCPVDDACTAFQIFNGFRVVLPAIELLKGTHVWIAVIQVGNQAQINLVIFGMVQKGTAA